MELKLEFRILRTYTDMCQWTYPLMNERGLFHTRDEYVECFLTHFIPHSYYQIVCIDKDKPIGMIGMMIDADDVTKKQYLYVRDLYTTSNNNNNNRKISNMLIKQVRQYGIENNFNGLWLCLNIDNQYKLVHYYKKQGFELGGLWLKSKL